VKWMIDRGTLAAVFIAVFFVVTVVAENYLTDRYGWAFGGIGAGLLLFALAPLQRLADRVADAAMPGVKPVGQMTVDERLALYAAQLRAAYHDGHVDAGERRMLESLRQNLSIDAETAMRAEAECTGSEP
ncbi:MAG: hypothetical protein KY455_01670, partial [Euryarchaeota archaeon]|nr:hypothetical protein [Euryarchaeota archaeon]